MLALLFRTQIQDGASWDTVTTISIGILLLAGAGIVFALVGSSILQGIRALKTRVTRKER